MPVRPWLSEVGPASVALGSEEEHGRREKSQIPCGFFMQGVAGPGLVTHPCASSGASSFNPSGLRRLRRDHTQRGSLIGRREAPAQAMRIRIELSSSGCVRSAPKRSSHAPDSRSAESLATKRSSASSSTKLQADWARRTAGTSISSGRP
jgi:hypothetical protein